MSDLVLAGLKDDGQWECYIREADPARAMFERAKRMYEYREHCRNEYGKRGGSHYSAFMLERFGLDSGESSRWASIGSASPKLLDNVQKFAPDARAVYEFTKLPEEQQDALLWGDGQIDRKAVSSFKTKARREEVDRQAQEIAAGTSENPAGLFHVISIDPPWPYRDGIEHPDYDPKGHRASNPYPEMSLEQIGALNIPAHDDCVLWLWTTHRFMRHSFALLDGWGFQDRAILTWVKDRMGLGRWLRSQSEFCIMATKGKPVIDLSNQTTVLNGPMREHSRKPDEFYSMVESLCPGRKLDFFSREPRAGWEQIGNDPEKFAA